MLNNIESIIEDLKTGKMVVLVDDEDKENEGDLVIAADNISPEIINFMAKYGRGLICLTLTEDKSHTKELKANQYDEIDLVIVNFYPFEKTLDQTTNHSKIIENIDVGGPTMVRAAAKNYNDVTVITSSDQYETLINELENNKGSTSIEFREKMSLEAFSETAYYDAVISNYFNKIKKNNFPKKKLFMEI